MKKNGNLVYIIAILLCIWLDVTLIIFFVDKEQDKIAIIIKIFIIIFVTFCFGIYFAKYYFNKKISAKWFLTIYAFLAIGSLMASYIADPLLAIWLRLLGTLILPNASVTFLGISIYEKSNNSN